MTLDSRTQALLDLVLTDGARRRDAILGDARERASAMLATAHAQARQRLRETFDEERRRFASRLDAARAGLETHRRLRLQRRAAEFLAAGLGKLPQALCDRWQRSASRIAWVEHVTAEASAALPRGSWRVVHAPGLTDGELEAIAGSIAALCGTRPQLVADSTMRAGLKIDIGGNVVDATLGGLVADRVEIGASLLKHLEVDG
jgi:hypothetical protein